MQVILNYFVLESIRFGQAWCWFTLLPLNYLGWCKYSVKILTSPYACISVSCWWTRKIFLDFWCDNQRLTPQVFWLYIDSITMMLRREIPLRNPLVVNGYHLRISSEGSPYFGLQLRANWPFPVLKKYTKHSARILIVQGVRLVAGEGGA